MSVFLIAVGAILAFAVELTTEGVDIQAVGVILMVLGLLGLVLALIGVDWADRWWGRSDVVVHRSDDIVVEDEYPAVHRRRYLRGR